jgi:hypothetical protein
LFLLNPYVCRQVPENEHPGLGLPKGLGQVAATRNMKTTPPLIP